MVCSIPRIRPSYLQLLSFLGPRSALRYIEIINDVLEGVYNISPPFFKCAVKFKTETKYSAHLRSSYTGAAGRCAAAEDLTYLEQQGDTAAAAVDGAAEYLTYLEQQGDTAAAAV